MTTVSFSGDEQAGFGAIPSGVYPATVRECEEEESKGRPPKPQLKVVFELAPAAGDGIAGRLLFRRYSYSLKSSGFLKQFLVACGVLSGMDHRGEVKLDDELFSECIGHAVRIKVGPSRDPKWPDSNEVGDVTMAGDDDMGEADSGDPDMPF
jgi:hypothetical protein